ncbi:MAG TPA: M28 family metallopeptidase [Saprospiraceae bacterium]|nr:M28 family peptidase [Saprospiraceae bacterium]HPG07012.1 M28 family metallopeptidase [Saprospiraceae bacterium]HRV86924.1 M28 family metallopeptidase [Saprospiraceae bacterium]
MRVSYVLVLAVLVACQTTQQPVTVESSDFDQYLSVLASDSLQGRKPFTKGEELTVDYLKNEMQDMGIEPGNGDSYYQKVPMVEITGHPAEEMKISGQGAAIDLQLDKDFVATTQREEEKITLNGSELVFCGYGIVAPEYGKNDYAGMDMHGKTALVLVNDPGFRQDDSVYFKGNTMTYYGRWTYKYEEGARQGADAVIIIHETNMAGYPWFVVQSGWSGARLGLQSTNKNADKCAIESWITLDAAKRIMEAAGVDFAQLIQNARKPDFKPQSLGMTVSTSLENTFKYDESRNVVGKITGSSHPDEYILYSAHWDHFGIGKVVDGDSIYNGALDNGSGTAGLLAIAKAFTKLPKAPDRSVIFLFVTGEEQGLLGSQYYAEHPIYPIPRTIADINMDGLNPNGPMKDLTITGLGQSDMDDIAKEEAAKQGRYILGEQEPEKGYFYRSDHFNFAKVGVPALFAQGGYDHAEKGKEYAMEKQKDYTANRYHKPQDEYDKTTWDLRGIKQDMQLFFNIGIRLADGQEMPQWKANSEFRAKREADLKLMD